ncbi:hypothetical protein ACN47E_002200 [Coniothyrium glycines]
MDAFISTFLRPWGLQSVFLFSHVDRRSKEDSKITSCCEVVEDRSHGKAKSRFRFAATLAHVSNRAVGWKRIDAVYGTALDENARYWWESSGRVMAILLEDAGYSQSAKHTCLDFFAKSICPNLGAAVDSKNSQWKSFMTDDHTPIELSWDWHTGLKAPQIRFSVEPIGRQAGTAQDPRNQKIAPEFLELVKSNIPSADMQWFDHFKFFFNCGLQQDLPSGHPSSIFWAFDLDEKEITAKAYFFPEYRAAATNSSTLQVLSEAIATAPGSTFESLNALRVFRSYAFGRLEKKESPLEMDMLAIDLVKPFANRFKIYFRIRETSFQAVRDAMTMNGQITGTDIETGVQNLRQLWNLLFDQEGIEANESLPHNNHRTAGMLFNAEFRLGSKVPNIKIYLPVRHYAQNDWQIINAVQKYMDVSTRSIGNGPAGDRKPPTSTYGKTMSTIFGQDTLRQNKGKQTYVGCSIKAGGSLRIVSYFNPRHAKFL